MTDSGKDAYADPYAAVTPTDRSGQLVIVEAVALITTLYSIGLRIYISYRKSQKTFNFRKDDILCFVAAFFVAVESALVWTSVAQGNGKAINSLSPQHLDNIQRIEYAIDIIYPVIFFCSRASVILLFERLQGLGPRPLWKWSLVLLFLCFVASVFAVTLKCDLRRPWIQHNVQCTGLLSRWQAIEILGIITEIYIFGLAVHIVYAARLSRSASIQITLLFATRGLVVVFLALQIIYLPKYFQSTNPTYSGITTTPYAFTAASASVITATIPMMKSFIEGFNYNTKVITVVKPPFSVESKSGSSL